MGGKCYVYIIETSAGAYKVGVAHDPHTRHRALKQGIPDPSHILHTILCPSRSQAFDMERSLHRRLEKYHTVGEWFKPPKTIIDNLITETKPLSEDSIKIEPSLQHAVEAESHKESYDRPLLMLDPSKTLKESVLEIIQKVSNCSRRRPELARILTRTEWYGISSEQTISLINELKSERKIIELHPGLYRFP